MTLGDLTVLQFQLIALIDSGKHEGVSLDDVKTVLSQRTLIAWLDQRFPGQFDTSLYTGSRASHGADVVKALDDAAGGINGRERKKLGVEHNGICLLAALVTEAIQSRSWP